LAFDWVAPIYDWFTEEYDIADPQDAKAFRCEPGWLYLAERRMSSGHLPNCLEPATSGISKSSPIAAIQPSGRLPELATGRTCALDK
jgi:hypothetical protein